MKSVVIKAASVSSEYTGRIFSWTCLALVIVLCSEVILRYGFNNPTLWGTDIPRMLGAVIACMGFSYTHLHRGHIRVDLIYARLSLRKRAIFDVIATLVFFLPLLAVLIYIAWTSMLFSWVHSEKWAMSCWYPPIAPLKTIIFIGLCLFFLQVVSDFFQIMQSLVQLRVGSRR